MSTSEADIRRIMKGARVSVRSAVQLLMSEVMLEIVQRTPVDTGFLRANWVLSVGERPLSIRDAREAETGKGTPPPSPVTVARLEADLNSFEIGDVLYFVNNAKYASIIEYGSPNQPNRTPARMLTNTLANLKPLEKKAIEFAKRQRQITSG